MQISDGSLMEVLRHFMLPCLFISSLAYLRGSCCACQYLVDVHTGPLWKEAAQARLSAEAGPWQKKAMQSRKGCESMSRS